MQRLITSAVLLFAIICSYAAGEVPPAFTWDDFVQSLCYDEETMDEGEWERYLDNLELLHSHPLNINEATPEEMALIPFLTPRQIENIQAYVHLEGPMRSIGELALISSIDRETLKALPLFLYVGKASWAQSTTKKPGWFDGLKHTADSRIDIPFYYRKGQLNGAYAGDGLRNRLRYNMQSRNVLVGIHVEKDAGERFYDSYGGYLMIRDRGIIRQAILGDYRIGWGEGLVMGNGGFGGKSSMLLGTSRGIRPMTGTSETGFLRGGALCLSGKGWTGSVFCSIQAADATLNIQGQAQTIITNGLHRTAAEREKKGNTLTTIAGGRMERKIRHFTIGAGGYWLHLNRTLNPGTALYRRWYARGCDFGSMGLDASFSHYRWNAAAEMAYSTAHNGVAACGRVSYLASRRLKVGIHGRYFSHKYNSFMARSLSENSNVQNESGVLVRIEGEPVSGWTIVSYSDFFADYWTRYRMTHSSAGQEFMLQNSIEAGKGNTIALRYQLKRKEESDLMQTHHRVRLQWTLAPTERWKLQTTGSIHIVGKSSGMAASFSGQGTWLRGKQLRTSLMLGYFNSPDYLSKVYIYEPALWNSIGGSTYSGHGLRIATTLRYTLKNKRWMFEAKYSLTKMFDRSEISSGLETIFSDMKNDLSIQIRMVI